MSSRQPGYQEGSARVERSLPDSHADFKQEMSLSQSIAEGLPTLGSSSMDSLLAYLSDTTEAMQAPYDDPPLRINDSKDSSTMRSRQTPNGGSSTSRNTAMKKRLDEPNQALSTPTSPLLNLVKSISSQGVKKIGTSSYEAWLSNVPSPILKSPRNNGYQKLQQTRADVSERDMVGDVGKESQVDQPKREGPFQNRKGLGLQLESITPVKVGSSVIRGLPPFGSDQGLNYILLSRTLLQFRNLARESSLASSVHQRLDIV